MNVGSLLQAAISRRDSILTVDLDRTKRVKEARDEAKKEIDAYKKQKDDEFKKFEAEVCRQMCPTVLLRHGDCLIDSRYLHIELY